MDKEYDVVVLGTGLKECLLSGLLSVHGFKVLHMDRNDYYGGQSASLNLLQLWQRFREGSDGPPASLGPSKEYNIDMVPKFMMANGELVRVLVQTNVTRYLELMVVNGSYVFNKGNIHKVPSSAVEALHSPLMGFLEKLRAQKFFSYAQKYDEHDPRTYGRMDLTKLTTKELFAKFGLAIDTIDFIGHAVALHRDDSYLSEPALETIQKVKLYDKSFQETSPYVYPLYGLGELPQAFARLSAIYGGTYMLQKPDCIIEFDEEGKVRGVTSGTETVRAKKVVCDPSYASNKVRRVGKVVRAICIMSHPIPNTNQSASAQIILPQRQLNRKSDMYIFCCSHLHKVAPKGKYVAFVSTEVETDDPQRELGPGLALLGNIDEMFIDVYDRFEPMNDWTLDNCFISKSYDATTHFETTVADTLVMFKCITGKELNLSKDLAAAQGG